MNLKRLIAACTLLALLAAAANAAKPPSDDPLVIGHRGASGYRPEHTLASYELAARMGADYVEPDLVSTADGILVARHENEISGTTDVASHPEFASRHTTKTIDDVAISGWFTEDFTLAELRTLRAKERIPELRQSNTIYNGRYRVPTLQEVIDLTERLSRELDREIGIYPETKHPTYSRSIGLPLEPPLVRTLRRNHLDDAGDPVFVQSFETGNLKRLDREIDVPLVQLFGGKGARPYDHVLADNPQTYGQLATPSGLSEVATYSDGVGPPKDYIVPRDGTGRSLAFLPLELRSSPPDPAAYGNAIAEYEQFFALGVDGLFSDNPDTAVEARP